MVVRGDLARGIAGREVKGNDARAAAQVGEVPGPGRIALDPLEALQQAEEPAVFRGKEPLADLLGDEAVIAGLGAERPVLDDGEGVGPLPAGVAVEGFGVDALGRTSLIPRRRRSPAGVSRSAFFIFLTRLILPSRSHGHA
jgi:hypothetical protein